MSSHHTPPLYVASNSRGLALNGRKWHLAAHAPTGYGVRALCGLGFTEGYYRTHGPDVAGPICKTCEKLDDRA